MAAGQGTVALEMLEDAPDIDCMVTPIGGGGLISGMATVARALRPEMDVVGVQAALFPSMYARIRGEECVCGGDTLAEGIAVKAPGEFTAKVIAQRVDEILLVEESALEKAVSLLLQIEKTVVEGAGAAGLAAVLAHPERFRGRKIGLVLCGGNIDPRLLANVLLRDLARSGRQAGALAHRYAPYLSPDQRTALMALAALPTLPLMPRMLALLRHRLLPEHGLLRNLGVLLRG